MMTETRHRFLAAIAGRLPAGAVVELRLFPSLRVGPVESGVAVVATDAAALADAAMPVDAAAAAPETATADPGVTSPRPASPDTGEPPGTDAPQRFSILTARYRLTLKGPDRGGWDFDLVHDADAPLATLEQVVRGVVRRLGEEGEAELFTGAELARVVAEPWWSATA